MDCPSDVDAAFEWGGDGRVYVMKGRLRVLIAGDGEGLFCAIKGVLLNGFYARDSAT